MWALQTLTNLKICHRSGAEINLLVTPKVAVEIQDKIAFAEVHIYVMESQK